MEIRLYFIKGLESHESIQIGLVRMLCTDQPLRTEVLLPYGDGFAAISWQHLESNP